MVLFYEETRVLQTSWENYGATRAQFRQLEIQLVISTSRAWQGTTKQRGNEIQVVVLRVTLLCIAVIPTLFLSGKYLA